PPVSNPVSISLNETFTLKIGELASIETENLELKLAELTEESRCPVDVQCIQAGQVSFRFTFTKDGQLSETFNLTERAGNNSLAEKDIDDYKILLKEVQPDTFKADSPPAESDYQLELEIRKL